MSSINLNIGGNVGGVQAGDNNTQNVTQNNAPQVPTVQSFFGEISKALPPDTDADTQAAHEALNAIEAIAATQPEVPAVTPEEKSSMMAMLTPYVAKLAPYAPLITKALLAFGDGFFSTLENKNPVIAGLVESIKGMRS